jgi:hypothetical protein
VQGTADPSDQPAPSGQESDRLADRWAVRDPLAVRWEVERMIRDQFPGNARDLAGVEVEVDDVTCSGDSALFDCLLDGHGTETEERLQYDVEASCDSDRCRWRAEVRT